MTQDNIPTNSHQINGDPDLNNILVKFFEVHSISALIESGWIVLSSGHKLAVRTARELPAPEGMAILQLDFCVQLIDGRLLIESFAGLGASKEDATHNAFENYISNSFHVILSLLTNTEYPDQIYSEEWTINGHKRRVLIGGISLRRFKKDEFIAPTSWFDSVQKEIEQLPLDERCHWIRCYYAQMDGQPQAIEALLDNQKSPELLLTMQQTNWPADPDFYSLRVFLIIQEAGK